MSASITQLSLFVQNQPGSMKEVLRVLAEGGIDINGLSVADTTEYGVLRMILSDPEKAERLLQNAGFAVKATQVLAIDVVDTPGGLYRPVSLMADAGINIDYMYAFGTKLSSHAMIIFRTADNIRAEAVLAEAGIPVLNADEVRERMYS
ncbi:MAG: ACT domain-containing protein [Firmicutes bacterium]|nr:ACT domain-containing protein [Bacillota bacterium]MBQ5960164.1 ACT domain-containing protein [Bacillota bacterium]